MKVYFWWGNKNKLATMEVIMNLENNTHMICRRDDMMEQTKQDRSRGDLMCLFWMCKLRKPAWLKEGEDNKTWARQILTFREAIKKGKMKVFRENLKAEPHECDGRKYWGLNIQYADPDVQVPDPLSTMLFGWFCPGHTYWFPDKENRDQSWRLLTHGLCHLIKPACD